MSSQQSGLVAGNAQNEAGGSVPRSRSRFPLSDSFFTTERFADYNPCFVMEGVSGDKITLNQPHQVRTYTLKAPLLQNILKKKDFFMVPMQALLPINWEKFYTNPVIGDDVPLGVGTGVPNFWGRLVRVFDSDKSTLVTTLNGSASDSAKLTALFKFLVFYEMFYSNGSLLKNLRIGGNAYLPLSRIVTSSGGSAINRDSDFDEFFDVCIQTLLGVNYQDTVDRFNITIGSKTYDVELKLTDLIGTNNAGTNPIIGIREVLELLRDDLNFTVNSVSVTGQDPFANVATEVGLFGVSTVKIPIATGSNIDFKTQGVPLNIARLAAYQMIVAHYYSNDHIDVLYSAELYRSYIRSLFLNAYSGQVLNSAFNTFLYNGVRYEYDSLSAYVCNLFLAYGTPVSNFTTAFTSVFSRGATNFAYFISLFGFKKSLRFMDYFTGSRSRPLAIGDANVDTSGSQVGVLDIARKFQATRFYNAVNRSGRKFSAYMKELFGIVPKPDYHNPFYLAHTSDVVGGQETENTGSAQLTENNSITTILRSNAARYAFSFEPDRDCIILGISYYDLPRVYTRATERQNFYLDRMDMFNPFMQYIGDQSIFNAEIGSTTPDLQPFSYTNRDMEYKQRFNMAAGGFCARSTQLDEWFFPADVLRRWFGTNIGSSFIRSFNSEFDRFYISLTGYSLGTYWHFIVRYDDRCDASRPMAYAPGILQ